MAKQNIHRWCQQNNWTEPRQLTNGLWVAFPPGGVIETPLPQFSPLTAESTPNYLQDIIYGLVLVMAALIIGAIALIISPLFLINMVNRSRKTKLLSH